MGRRRPSLPATLLVTCLVGTGLAALPVTTAVAADGPAVVGDTSFSDGGYVVTLRDPAVASYEGGVPGLQATAVTEGEAFDAQAAPVKAYQDHLATEQERVAESVGAEISTQYSLATNGFAAHLTAAQAQKLAADPDVQAVVANEILQVQEAEPSTDFLGLSGDAGVWSQFGTGEGVVVGIIDTGIAPENPSFAGAPLGTTAGADPYLSGSTIVFDKADGEQFTGFCQRGEQFTADDCSTKIVGARYFVDGFGEGRIADAAGGEYVSPRDGDSHGSHTGSTAVGNADVPVTIDGRDFGTISGVAPDAKIAAYKVCWTGDATRGIADGCATQDLLSAIDAAVQDGVDVINYSIGGGGADSTVSLTDAAFFEAARTGIFVAASAGNSGPTESTVDNAAPWITTVAASTIPSYDATVRVTPAAGGASTSYLGGSTSLSTDPAGLSGRFVDSRQLVAAGVAEDRARLCAPGSLDAAKLAALAGGDDAIVLCDRGETDRVSKSAEVERIGGVGTVLVNPTPSSVDVDAHPIPTVHVDAAAYDALHAAATAGEQVTLLDGNPDQLPEPTTPQIAGFSSRGPLVADGGNLIKPDVSAPGVAILAAGANAEGAAPTYEFLSGTSMSSPHIAGIAALYFGERPNASPMEVKSAIMTTAYDLVAADGSPNRDVFAQGAGHVDPSRMFDAGLYYLSDEQDWLAYAETVGTAADSQLNLPSIAVGSMLNTTTVTRTVTSTGAGTFTAEPLVLPGVDAVVSPSTLTFTGPGQEASYDVTFTRTTAAPNEYATGYLTWTDGARDVRSAVAVRPLELTAPAEVDGTGLQSQVTYDVTAGADLSEALRADGLVAGQVETGSGTAESDPVVVPVTVAADDTHGRFVLDSANDEADLDLSLYELEAGAAPALVAQSATGSADEQIDVDLGAGQYELRVEYFSGDGPLDWSLTSFLVAPAGAQAPVADGATVQAVDPLAPVGTFTVTPTTLTAAPGQTVAVTAAWSGLAPEQSYLGRVVYGDTGVETFVAVESGPAVVAPDPGVPAPGDPGAPGAPAPGDPGAAPAPGAPGSGTGTAAGGAPLAFTGQDVLPAALAALLLLLAGVGVTVAARRRGRQVAAADAPSTEA